MKRLLGFLAVAGLVTFAAPGIPVQAASLIGPGTAEQTKVLSDDLAVEVRHRGGGGFRGFHGGGRHFGGAHFGGHRFGHRPHFHGHRFVHHHRPFIVRRHVWRPYPYYAEPRLYCRRVWTDFGPRRICRYRPWWV